MPNPSTSIHDKALMGRINTGTGLLGKEKEIAAKVPANKNDKNKYTLERLRTNPLVRGGASTALSTGAGYVFKSQFPKALTAIRKSQQDYLSLNKPPQFIVNALKLIPEKWRNYALVSEDFINTVKGGTSHRRIAETALAAGALSAIGTYMHRREHAKELLRQTKEQPSAYIRTKLAEIPIGAIDDAALYLTKAVKLVEEQQQIVDPNKKPKALVQKELQKIEKQATMYGLGIQAKNFGRMAVHPVETAVAVQNATERFVDKVSPGAIPHMRNLATSPIMGATEVGAITHGANIAGKLVTKGAVVTGKAGKQIAVKTVKKAKPFLSRAFDIVANTTHNALAYSNTLPK
jgi:hypothetical protein